jgi:hypothetical protein
MVVAVAAGLANQLACAVTHRILHSTTLSILCGELVVLPHELPIVIISPGVHARAVHAVYTPIRAGCHHPA